MKTFEQKLLDEVYLAREEQWKRCVDWDNTYMKQCTIYNQEPCPMRCSYSEKRLRKEIK